MKCLDCPFFDKPSVFYNKCNITGLERITEKDDCDIINSDGTVNSDSKYFKQIEE